MTRQADERRLIEERLIEERIDELKESGDDIPLLTNKDIRNNLLVALACFIVLWLDAMVEVGTWVNLWGDPNSIIATTAKVCLFTSALTIAYRWGKNKELLKAAWRRGYYDEEE